MPWPRPGCAVLCGVLYAQLDRTVNRDRFCSEHLVLAEEGSPRLEKCHSGGVGGVGGRREGLPLVLGNGAWA